MSSEQEELWRQWAREYSRQYYINNKERCQAYNKAYREKNKDLFKAKYEARKDVINARRRADPKRTEYMKMHCSLKVKCSCGMEVSKINLPRHTRSKQHIEAPTKVKQILGDKTNPDITDRILSYL